MAKSQQKSLTSRDAPVEGRELNLGPREWRLEVWRTIQECVRELSPEDAWRYTAGQLPFDEELQRRFRERGLVPRPQSTY